MRFSPLFGKKFIWLPTNIRKYKDKPNKNFDRQFEVYLFGSVKSLLSNMQLF